VVAKASRHCSLLIMIVFTGCSQRDMYWVDHVKADTFARHGARFPRDALLAVRGP
jgi:hypothetical protein